MSVQAQTLVGCCGFALPRKAYFKRFPVVEIQQSFYDPPRIQTALEWREQAPDGFSFTLKAWQLITHDPSSPTYRRLRTPIDPRARRLYGSFRPTSEVFAAWERTLLLAKALEASLVVFQCPAAFRPETHNLDNMRSFFGSIPREGIPMAWEPRGNWPMDLVESLCHELDLIHCVDPFRGLPVAGGIRYFRLHGVTGYGYVFTDHDLSRLRSWCQGVMTYVLFNNRSMTQDAMRFKLLLEEPGS